MKVSEHKERYFQALEACLHKEAVPNASTIVLEYRHHLDGKVYDLMLQGQREESALQVALIDMPEPTQVASAYQQVLEPRPIPYTFIGIINCLILALGFLITLFYVNGSTFGHMVWDTLVAYKWVILMSYAIFWLVIGLVVGQRYGFYQKQAFKRNTLLAMIPNYLFMVIVLIGLQQGWVVKWFEFLSHSSVFVFCCVSVTFAFYPITQLGYRVGVIRGI